VGAVWNRTEGRAEIAVRRGSHDRHLLVDLKEEQDYCKLKEEVVDGTVCGVGFGRGCGAVRLRGWLGILCFCVVHCDTVMLCYVMLC
jgi:hypothetical protein